MLKRVAVLVTLVCTGVLAFALAGSASASIGTISNLRDAASTVISAEIHGYGSSACGKLYAPLAKTIDGKTCAERWDARSRALLARKNGEAHLLADYNAVATAKITIRGLYATMDLPYPLLGGKTLWYWTDNCWMLMN
jgi:hypothetical protein